jgi:hypothetical protein
VLILDEMSRALVASGRKADSAAAARHEALMRAALPHAEVSTDAVQAQFEAVAWAMRSTKDIHVAACAGIEVLRPDAFLQELFSRNEHGVAAAFAALRGTLRSNPTPERLIERLAADGQTEVAASILASWRAGAIAI